MPLTCLSLQRIGDFAKACDSRSLVKKCSTKRRFFSVILQYMTRFSKPFVISLLADL